MRLRCWRPLVAGFLLVTACAPQGRLPEPRAPRPLPSSPAPQPRFLIQESEALDAATFLNAVGDHPRFTKGWAALRREWRPRFAAAPEAVRTAFQQWNGRGIQLAYLLSALPVRSLDGLIAMMRRPDVLLSRVERALDEPAYRPDLDRLRRTHRPLATLFAWLRDQGFGKMRRARFAATLRRTRRRLRETLGQIHAGDFVKLLQAFIGRPVPHGALRLVVLAFSRPTCFQLTGFGVGWSESSANPGWLLAHEFLHKYNPSRAVLARLRHLARVDPVLAEARRRVQGEFLQGEEEELVDGAAAYLAWGLGLQRRKRVLRGLRWRYPSARTRQAGVPLAALIFDALRRARVMRTVLSGEFGRFHYDTFLLDLFQSPRLHPGRVRGAVHEILRPVSGTAGVALGVGSQGAFVRFLLPRHPAIRAGLRPGDRILRINGHLTRGKALPRLLDYLTGPPGKAIAIIAGRGHTQVRVTFTLAKP